MKKKIILNSIAEQLPPLPLYTTNKQKQRVMQTTTPTRVITGAQWLKENPGAKTTEGKTPEPQIKYILTFDKITLNVNHQKEIKKTYKAEGAPGVQKYINLCFGFSKLEPTPAVLELLNTLTTSTTPAQQ